MLPCRWHTDWNMWVCGVCLVGNGMYVYISCAVWSMCIVWYMSCEGRALVLCIGYLLCICICVYYGIQAWHGNCPLEIKAIMIAPTKHCAHEDSFWMGRETVTRCTGLHRGHMRLFSPQGYRQLTVSGGRESVEQHSFPHSSLLLLYPSKLTGSLT